MVPCRQQRPAPLLPYSCLSDGPDAPGVLRKHGRAPSTATAPSSGCFSSYPHLHPLLFSIFRFLLGPLQILSTTARTSNCLLDLADWPIDHDPAIVAQLRHRHTRKSPAMPPKKARGTKAAAPPLDGCTIALSGTFPGRSQSALEKDVIVPLGAALARTINEGTTYLITTDADYAKPSAKVKQAQSQDIRILRLAWLEDCLAQATKLSEDSYGFEAADDAVPDPPPAAPAAATNGKAGSRKRTAAVIKDDSEDDKAPPQPKKKTKAQIKAEESKAASTNGSQAQSQTDTKSALANRPKTEAKPKPKAEVEEVMNNIAKSADLVIPVDETCPLVHYQVYIDEDGLIYDASLNQTHASNNNNKFYRVQVCNNPAMLSFSKLANSFLASSE
jgi:hypothetical protein